MIEISVRPARESDAETIRDFQKEMALETEGLVLDNETVTRGVYAVFGDSSKGRYYVAEYEGSVIASLLIT
ncbi:MAG: GNAT family N-acetyltransferase, partial [Bacteroidetes bacterium]|nr:GNAT family N-acetyltransferase [Bacteroidota bacterium]